MEMDSSPDAAGPPSLQAPLLLGVELEQKVPSTTPASPQAASNHVGPGALGHCKMCHHCLNGGPAVNM